MRFALHHMRRQLVADPRTILTLIAVVLLSALLTTSVLRLLADAENRQARYDLAAASPWQREPSANIIPGSNVFLNWGYWQEVTEGEPTGPTDYQRIEVAMLQIRDELPEPYRSQLVDARAVTESGEMYPGVPGSPIRVQTMHMRTDPRFDEVAEIVAGRWPESTPADWVVPQGSEDTEQDAYERWQNRETPEEHPIEVVISAGAAELIDVGVGDEFRVTSHPFVIVGIYQAIDQFDEYWNRIGYAAEPYYFEDQNSGPQITYSAYAHESWGPYVPGSSGFLDPSGSKTILWYPVDESALEGADLSLIASQARAFANAQSTLQLSESFEVTTRFFSQTPDLLEGSLARIDVVRTVLALVAVGPLAILLSVLGLGVRLIVDRRTKSTAQLAARGASTGQIVIPAVVEGLLVSIPTAAVGIAAAYFLTPGPWNWFHAVPGIVLALIPGLMLAIATRNAAQGRTGRADLGGTASRWRLVGEIMVLLVAALALISLFNSNNAVGQLVAPIAVTAALIVLALRLYPAPVALAERSAARGRKAPGFVGLARARRSPSGGLTPVISLVAGVSAALIATVLWSTVNAGVQETIWQRVGADVRVSGPVIDPEALEAIDGINRVATITDMRTTAISTGGRAQMVAVDAEAFGDIQANAPGIDSVAPLLEPRSDAVPVMVTEGAPLELGDVSAIAGTRIEVVGIIERLGGYSLNTQAIVVDREAWKDASGRNVWPRIALVDGDQSVVEEQLTYARIDTPQTMGADFTASPLGKAMSTSLVAGLAVAAALIALTVFLMQLLDAPARARVTAVMRTMGVYPGEVRRITAASMLPTVLISLAAGIVAGAVLPWLLTVSADLRPLTGSEFQPTPVYDPIALGAVIAGIVLVLALAIWWAARAAGRASLARELRSVED